MKKSAGRALALTFALLLCLALSAPLTATADYEDAVGSVVAVVNGAGNRFLGGFIVCVDGSDVYVLTDALAVEGGSPTVVYGELNGGITDPDTCAPARVVATVEAMGIVLLVTPAVPAVRYHNAATLAPISVVSNGESLHRLGAGYDAGTLSVNALPENIYYAAGDAVGLSGGTFSLSAAPALDAYLWVGGPVVTLDGMAVGISVSASVDGYDSYSAVCTLDPLITYLRDNGLPVRVGGGSSGGMSGGTSGGGNTSGGGTSGGGTSGGGNAGGNTSGGGSSGNGGSGEDEGGIGKGVIIVAICAAGGALLWTMRKKASEGGGSAGAGAQGATQQPPGGQPFSFPSCSGQAPAAGAASASLDATGGPLAGSRFPLRLSGVTIGRRTDQCAVIFPPHTPGVSGVHCRVDYSNGSYTLTDLGSSNGTFLNGQRMISNLPMPLTPGSVFYLGSPSNSFIFRIT